MTRLVGELRYLRQIMESMKRVVTGQGLEEESGEEWDQLARLEETEEKEKCERVMTYRYPGSKCSCCSYCDARASTSYLYLFACVSICVRCTSASRWRMRTSIR